MLCCREMMDRRAKGPKPGAEASFVCLQGGPRALTGSADVQTQTEQIHGKAREPDARGP